MRSFTICIFHIKEDEMGGACGTRAETLSDKQILVVNPEGMKPRERPMREWDDNIKMVLK
jgi:hypothetical protein